MVFSLSLRMSPLMSLLCFKAGSPRRQLPPLCRCCPVRHRTRRCSCKTLSMSYQPRRNWDLCSINVSTRVFCCVVPRWMAKRHEYVRVLDVSRYGCRLEVAADIAKNGCARGERGGSAPNGLGQHAASIENLVTALVARRLRYATLGSGSIPLTHSATWPSPRCSGHQPPLREERCPRFVPAHPRSARH
jgi:hypothetical protein